jgi:hypothetical protein
MSGFRCFCCAAQALGGFSLEIEMQSCHGRLQIR